MFHKLEPFLIMSIIGLMIGIERERRQAQVSHAIGVRTFVLLGLLGALAGWVRDPIIALGFTLFVSGVIIASYFRTSQQYSSKMPDVGITTELAAGATFALGFLAHYEQLLTAVLGVLVLVTLLSRKSLHEFSRETITPGEIQAAATLVVLAVGILPLLPDVYVDPWEIINPRTFLMIVVVIGSIQFGGYAAVRFFGAKLGIPLSGFLSGMVSSTAAFMTLPRLIKHDQRVALAASAAAVMATIASLLKLLVVVYIASPDLLGPVTLFTFFAIAIGALFSVWATRQNGNDLEYPAPSNPLALGSAIRLAAIIAGFLASIRLISRFFGDTALQLVSFVGGLGDLHGVSFGAASLHFDGHLQTEIALNAIMLATVASLVSKLVITWFLSRRKYLFWVSLAIFAMLVAVLVPWAIMTFRIGMP